MPHFESHLNTKQSSLKLRTKHEHIYVTFLLKADAIAGMCYDYLWNDLLSNS